MGQQGTFSIFLVSRGNPGPSPSLLIPEEDGEGNVVVRHSRGLGVRRPGRESLLGHLPALEPRAGHLTSLMPHVFTLQNEDNQNLRANSVRPYR